MHSHPRPSRASAVRRAALCVAALGLAAACGNGNTPGVLVDSQESDVVFGNTPTTPPAAVPNQGQFVPTGPGLQLPPGTNLPGLGFNNQPYVFPTYDQLPVHTDICPGPAPYATAPTAATTYVQGEPKAGFYFWQLITSTDLGHNVTTKKPKYTNYEIRNVSAVTSTPNPQGEPTDTFTYDQVAPIGGGKTITYTYQVKQNTPGANVGTVENVGTPKRVSEPDAGVAIKAEVERDADGKTIGAFNPTTAVLILPLPIVGGATFNGTGTDPTTGGSLQISGTVKGPDRVSGCTGYVQGYRVDASVTSSGTQGAAGPSVNQVFTLETQTGGLLVGNVQTPANSNVTTMSIVGDNRPTDKPKTIPKELQP